MNKIWKILIAFCVGLVLAVLIMWGVGLFSLTDYEQIFRRLSDAFFVPGVVFVGLGLLMFAANHGTFDMIAFGVGQFFSLFRRDLSKRKYKNFHDYKQAQAEKEKHSFDYLLYAGLALIVVSVVFLVLYYQYYTG